MLYHTSVCFTVKSLENTCHTWALLRWWFTTKRRYIKCMHLYLFTFTFTNKFDCLISWIGLFTECTISICLICLSVALYHSVARVRAMCQVNGRGSFSAPVAPKLLNRFTWNLASLITSTVLPHTQNTVAAENGGGVSIWVKFACFFGSFNASTAYPEKRGFSFTASENVFRWWVCSFGVDLPRRSNLPFLLPMGRIRLSFCMEVDRKHPLWLMIAP